MISVVNRAINRKTFSCSNFNEEVKENGLLCCSQKKERISSIHRLLFNRKGTNICSHYKGNNILSGLDSQNL